MAPRGVKVTNILLGRLTNGLACRLVPRSVARYVDVLVPGRQLSSQIFEFPVTLIMPENQRFLISDTSLEDYSNRAIFLL